MKNYEMINVIRAGGLPKDAENVVVRAFNKMNDAREPNGCLTTSVSLCIALEYLGYSPRLCIGKFWVNEHDFYHAWTELNGRVIDISIYGNTAFTLMRIDGIVKPQVNRGYSETDIQYEPFVFDDDFQNAMISQMMGRSFYYYCDSAPRRNAIWNLLLSYLDTSSSATLAAIKEIAKKHIIGEKGDANG